MKRVAWLLAAVLVIASCHSIDRGVFAQGPVPLDVLPLREPITYTVGPDAGQEVPSQNGLLASYFSGAAYVQPAYGEVLDHQQIDPNIDFQWDGSDTNPVIPVGGIDYGEGHPFRPDHWPIWSVVWEGYLEATTAGDHLFNLHVNNGGWLEMKDASSALTTVISCPGGSGFEGDCPATVNMTAGRHYIRISYFNNAPSAANAIFSWRPPGEGALRVVPTTSLWTQATKPLTRAFMFVHGINGRFTDRESFSLLLNPLRDRYGADNLKRFEYFQDAGYQVDGTCVEPRPVVVPTDSAGLPLDTSGISLSPSFCDSESNVGLNAVLLDMDIKKLHDDTRGSKVTVICNSMGCAITRAFLAYSVAAGTGVAENMVDSVISLQGAQQGSWAAYPLYELQGLASSGNPITRLNGLIVAAAVQKTLGFDALRPAARDLRPRSETYAFVNPDPAHVPANVAYFNAASDIRWRLDIGYFGYRFKVPIRNPADPAGSFGDYAILPGVDDPTATPLFGGARFLPGVIGRGRDNVAWDLRREVTIPIEAYPVFFATLGLDLPRLPGDPFGIPESHFSFGSRMSEIRYADRRTGALIPLDQLILEEIRRRDP